MCAHTHTHASTRARTHRKKDSAILWDLPFSDCCGWPWYCTPESIEAMWWPTVIRVSAL